ncbi:MAG: hypothetical protein WA699_13990, partial [Pseudolabrys sp.]
MNKKRENASRESELVAQTLNLALQSKPEISPLFVPIERQSRVIEEFARRQFRGMLSTKDRADNIWRQQRETEQPRRIGRNYILRFGNFV